MKKYILFIFLFVIQNSWSEPPENEPNQGASTSLESEALSSSQTKKDKPTLMPQTLWLSKVQQQFPDELCQSDSHFVHCFELDEKGCQSMVRWFSSACLNKMTDQMPEELDENQGAHWGRVAGRCIYDLYYAFLKKRYVEKEGCPAIKDTLEDQSDSDTSQPSEKLIDPTQPKDAF